MHARAQNTKKGVVRRHMCNDDHYQLVSKNLSGNAVEMQLKYKIIMKTEFIKLKVLNCIVYYK